jgi:hypothetical protein
MVQRRRGRGGKKVGRDSLLQRLWDKIGVTDDIEECWEWMGGGTKNGYGTIHIEMLPNGRSLRRSVTSVLYETAVGPLGVDDKGKSLEPDHLCRWTQCANPFHLEEVTHEENVHRASPTVCPHGHEYTPENTYTDKRGARHCRRCNANRGKLRKLGVREKLQPLDGGELVDVKWLERGGCVMKVKVPGKAQPVFITLTAQEAEAIVG